MQLIPGGGGDPFTNAAATKKGVDKAVEQLSPEMPEIPALPPPPTREDPEIDAARQKARDADLKRKGRKATILTSARGVEDELGAVNRPLARAAALLGQ